MPFKSEKQRRYLWKNHPEIAKRWSDKYGSKLVKKNANKVVLAKRSAGFGPGGAGSKNYNKKTRYPKHWGSGGGIKRDPKTGKKYEEPKDHWGGGGPSSARVNPFTDPNQPGTMSDAVDDYKQQQREKKIKREARKRRLKKLEKELEKVRKKRSENNPADSGQKSV